MPFSSGRIAVKRGRILAAVSTVAGVVGIGGGCVILLVLLQSLRVSPVTPNAVPAVEVQTIAATSPAKIEIKQRLWQDISGKFKADATLLECWNGTVYLQRNSRTIAVPLSRLCAIDRDYVKRAFPVETIHGTVVSLADGDTVTILDDAKTQQKIRLEGIDAPESNQAYGTQSKKMLGELVFRKQVKVEWREKDKYGRTLGHIFIADEWANSKLIKEGMAWHYKEYNHNGVLAAAELAAKKAKLGLWAEPTAIAPWDFRHQPVAPRPPPSVLANSYAQSPTSEPKEQTVYITSTGSKYHSAGCRHLRQSSSPISLTRAVASYSPCSHCYPATLSRSSSYASSVAPRQPAQSSYSDSSADRTPTGLQIYTGPRGGRYHYSKSGKKVYEKRR